MIKDVRRKRKGTTKLGSLVKGFEDRNISEGLLEGVNDFLKDSAYEKVKKISL